VGRLKARDVELVEALAEEAGTFRLGRSDFWERFLPGLGEALRARVPTAYGVRMTEDGPRVAFLSAHNPTVPVQELKDAMDAGFARLPKDFVGFSPARPQPKQRNQVVTLAQLREFERPGNIIELWRRAGIDGHDQLRVLLCESEALLAWVGAYRPSDDPFTSREHGMLQRLVPVLQRRLALEQQLASAPLARAALESSMEALARPALIVNDRAEPQFANTLARQLLAADAGALQQRLDDCLHGRDTSYAVTPVNAPGLPPHFLVVEQSPPREALPLVAGAATRWSLTAREAQTLALLADGLSNRAMAAHLGCSERTVEVHVARLLEKSDSESRAQLIARFWSEGTLKPELRKAHART
jgi:DNA-binding CsgD family transcriptional regulator